jgi:mitochondrial fission protein ELM1
MTPPESPRIWVLADPRAGTAAQALGIAERLGEPFRRVDLAWGALARLPLPFPSLAGLTPEARSAFAPPWPALVISAGRRSAPVALWLKQKGARLVHCMRPGFGATRFDLLVIGRHDAPKEAPNILPILGAAHRISPERLAAARAEFAALEALPSHRVALLMGGPPRAEGMDASVAGAITAMAAALAGHPHSLFRWGDAPPNPYAGFLAWADQVVVTGDSVSMLSEALATAGPVFIADPGGLGPRHKRLAESLIAAGQARDLAAAPAPFARAPLDESGRIAAEIRRRGLLG